MQITEGTPWEQTGPKHTKVCRLCKAEKQIYEFYKHSDTKDRLRSECKECWNAASLKYYVDNEVAIKQKRKDYHYRSNYGIELKDFERMYKEQDGKCAICKEKKRLVLDHNHANKRIRKLLCDKCNQGLGSFNDNPTWLREAANYLELN